MFQNLDKKARESGAENINALKTSYHPDSLHYMMLTSKVKPLGQWPFFFFFLFVHQQRVGKKGN